MPATVEDERRAYGEAEKLIEKKAPKEEVLAKLDEAIRLATEVMTHSKDEDREKFHALMTAEHIWFMKADYLKEADYRSEEVDAVYNDMIAWYENGNYHNEFDNGAESHYEARIKAAERMFLRDDTDAAYTTMLEIGRDNNEQKKLTLGSEELMMRALVGQLATHHPDEWVVWLSPDLFYDLTKEYNHRGKWREWKDSRQGKFLLDASKAWQERDHDAFKTACEEYLEEESSEWVTLMMSQVLATYK